MTPAEYTSHQRMLAETIRVAILRHCISADLNAERPETKQLVADALAQVLQVYRIEIDLDVDPRLGESATFPQRADCPRPLLEAVAAFCGGRVVETPEGER